MAKFLINLVVTIAVSLAIISMIIGKADASETWTKETYSKQENLISIGFSKQMSINIITGCKKSEKNPVMCIKIIASVMWAESSMGTRCYRNNCLWMNDWAVSYSSEVQGINAWVKKFDKWWYKQKNPSGFYRSDGTKPPTRYCMGKKKDWVCKEGTKNSWKVFNSLNF